MATQKGAAFAMAEAKSMLSTVLPGRGFSHDETASRILAPIF